MLSSMNQATKRIVLAFRLAGEPGRRKLDGFFRYMADHQLLPAHDAAFDICTARP